MCLVEINGLVYNFSDQEIAILDALQKKVDREKGVHYLDAKKRYNSTLRSMRETKTPLGEIYQRLRLND